MPGLQTASPSEMTQNGLRETRSQKLRQGVDKMAQQEGFETQSERLPQVRLLLPHMPKHTWYIQNQQTNGKKKRKKKAHKAATEEDILTLTSIPCMPAQAGIPLHTCAHTHIHIHVHTGKHTCIHTCTYMSVCTHMYMHRILIRTQTMSY